MSNSLIKIIEVALFKIEEIYTTLEPISSLVVEYKYIKINLSLLLNLSAYCNY